LHFDANGIPEDADVVRRVDEAARLLEASFDNAVEVVSFHMPTYRPVGHLRLARGRVNAYGPAFFGPIAYASDSNQDFRGKDLLRLFRERQLHRLQLLIHPFWWRHEYSSMGRKLDELARTLGLSLDDVLTAEQQTAVHAESEPVRPQRSNH
jgi:hypothetical protein